MDPRQREVTGQLEAPPDRRLRSVQVQAHAEAARCDRNRKERRLRPRVELFEDAGDLPAHQRIEERLALRRAGAGHQLLHEVLQIGQVELAGHGDQSIIDARYNRPPRQDFRPARAGTCVTSTVPGCQSIPGTARIGANGLRGAGDSPTSPPG